MRRYKPKYTKSFIIETIEEWQEIVDFAGELITLSVIDRDYAFVLTSIAPDMEVNLNTNTNASRDIIEAIKIERASILIDTATEVGRVIYNELATINKLGSI